MKIEKCENTFEDLMQKDQNKTSCWMLIQEKKPSILEFSMPMGWLGKVFFKSDLGFTTFNANEIESL